MKKIIIAFALILSLANSFGQSLLSKVPNDAAAVIKYAAENFTKNTTLQKIDSYSFIKKDFFKMLHMDSLTSIQHLGINFEKDAYQYFTMQDTAFSFVTLLNLKNADQFFKVIKASYNSTGKLETKNGFNFYSADADTYFGWNNEVAIIVVTSYQNKKSYYDYMYSSDTTYTTTAVVEAAPAVDVAMAPDEVFTQVEEPTQKKKPTTKGKKPVTKSNTAKIQALKKAKRLKEEREQFVRDSIETVKRDLWYQQQDMLAKKYQKNIAEKIMTAAFSGTTTSIQNDIKYTKIVEPAAHVSVWANTQNLATQYYNTFALGRYYGLGDTYYGINGSNAAVTKDSTPDFNNAVNIYFEKDRMRMEQKTFSTDAELTKLGNAILDSKQSNNILGYINADNIGYLSMSVNTEAMVNYYYTVIKNYFNNNKYISQESEAINLYVDFLQILIDEKGIAELMPGNYLFVLHDMKSRKVTYTDYEYDKEYNKKEIKKTKNELSPNFTFVMETRKESFMQRIVELPLKYAKKEKWNYTAKNGYHELVFKEGELPISSLYFMVKDGKGIITTSMEVVENTLANKSFIIDEETRGSIVNNNYSLKLNTKKLIEKLGPELSTNANKKVADYLLQNFGDVKMESKLKDGMIQGTTTMNIKGDHTNSFEFIFNLMDAINTIMEKEKMEDEKKIN
jgi:hypothetical protein